MPKPPAWPMVVGIVLTVLVGAVLIALYDTRPQAGTYRTLPPRFHTVRQESVHRGWIDVFKDDTTGKCYAMWEGRSASEGGVGLGEVPCE
jgi:hypothetical protein